MSEYGGFGRIVREPDGSCSALFGPFRLKTALQPLFEKRRDGLLELKGLEGLLRVFRNGLPISPAIFLARIDTPARVDLDALCRTLHLINAAAEPATNSRLFLNFDPALCSRRLTCLAQAEQLVKDCSENGFSPRDIVCEITEQGSPDDGKLSYLVETLRQSGFGIALDDFGAASSDMGRLELLQPDIVKLDAKWVIRLLGTASGYSALGQMIDRLHARHIVVVLEGLETGEQVELACGSGADLFQGFALARPRIVPAGFADDFASTVT